MSTIRTLILDAASQCPDNVALRWKSDGKWCVWTFADLLSKARNIAEAAASLGVKPGDHVAMMMENRPEWITTYLGLASCGITVVPIDANLLEREVSHILRDSESVAFFGSGKTWTLLHAIETSDIKLDSLKSIVMLDGVFSASKKEHNILHVDFESLMKATEKKSTEPDSFFDRNMPASKDLASIIYTSGTTGRAKGVMLTHNNFIAQLDSSLQYFKVFPDDNFLLVLPLHHAFAFTANFLIPLHCKCEISMVENLRTISENMKEVSPTILLAVPLLAEKMLKAILAKLNRNPAARIMMKIGLSRVVGKKVVENIGGRLRMIICGGAASDPEMLKTFKKLGILAFEGYGLTETSPIAALHEEGDIRFGSVGKALPGCPVRIKDPDENGIGEVQIKGPIVMQGYFRNDAATAEVFDGEWFCSGDLGKMDKDGYLTITGRKKSLIVNREGKNIYPEEVELAIKASDYILESVVIGYRLNGETGERVGVIVVPNLDRFEEDRKEKGQSMTDDEIIELCKKEVQRTVKEIADYKRPRRIHVRFEPLEKTTTQKVKRYLYSMDEA
jgi:long-chain acyl-CoA synthetase